MNAERILKLADACASDDFTICYEMVAEYLAIPVEDARRIFVDPLESGAADESIVDGLRKYVAHHQQPVTA